MAFVPIIMAAGAAMSAYGAIQQGQTASANYKAEQSAANYNAVVNQENAQQAGMLASSREQMQRSNAAQQLGQMRAAMAESGGGFTGTNVGVERQSDINAELDALSTRYQGVLQSRGYQAQAGLDYYQGRVAGVNAAQAKTGGYFGAAEALLGGATNIYGYETNSRIPRGFGGYRMAGY